MDYSIKTLAMLKMEKNFIAHIDKRYPRQPYKTMSLDYLYFRLSQETVELKEAILSGDPSLIREELADCSNVIDYMFEVACKTDVEREQPSPETPRDTVRSVENTPR